MLKIDPTARLLGITGSVAKRSAEASKITRNIYEDAVKLINKKGSINHRDLKKDIFTKHLPNVEIEIKPVAEDSYAALLDSKLNKAKTTITGYFMELNFRKPIEELLEDLIHETSHLADRLTRKKFELTSKGFIPDLKNSASVKRFNKYYDFYNNKLYRAVENPSKFNTEMLTTDLNELLRRAPKTEKIGVLDYFRYELLSEKNAYNAEYTLSPRLKNQNPANRYCFEEKIQMIEDLLRYEMI